MTPSGPSKNPKVNPAMAAKAAAMNNTSAPKPPTPPQAAMGGARWVVWAGAPKPPMGGMGGAPGGMGAMMKPGMGAPKPPMPGMKKGGKVKKKAKTYKSGGNVRGAGIAKQGVKKCKMR